MNKPKLLIVNNGQFGYQAGYYHYAKYLKDEFDITFLCHDRGWSKVELDGIKVQYISFRNKKIVRHLRWVRAVIQEIKVGGYDIVFSVYFRLCFLIGLLFSSQKTVILDIRTGSLKKNIVTNYLQNLQIKLESLFFKKITILSKGLMKHLGLKAGKCHWLPLGAEVISKRNSHYRDLKLLYVGNLYQRKIHETIVGFAKFYEQFGQYLGCTYDIFGAGTESEEELIRNTIKELNLEGVVVFHGRRCQQDLLPYYRASNVGVCYVPITKFFEFQPPTKTFEYILSGMVCIGTATYENIKLINKTNGLLCRDTPYSFFESLKAFYYKRHLFKYSRIVASLEKYKWSNIVEQNLKPLLINRTK
jgi:glycosyltransferase involved in cell wall biosynthesis